MDTRFAKIVTDMTGKDHILIDGRVIEIIGDADAVNPVVDAIVSALRSSSNEKMSLSSFQASVGARAVAL